MVRAIRFAWLPAIVVIGALAAVGVKPRADDGPAPKVLELLQTERSAMAQAFAPSVVAIAASKPTFGSVADRTGLASSMARAASGFVVDGSYVVTCMESRPLTPDGRGSTDPFLTPGRRVWMMAHDGTEFGGEIVGRDRRNLLLVVKMDDGHPDLPSLKLGDSDATKMGASAIGIGNTLDSMLIDRVVSFSYGTVSGFYRFEPVDVLNPNDPGLAGDPYKGNVLEVDVAIHQGDHGGPIINLDGEVIGMMSGHFMAGRHLGCAVPSNQIRAVLEQLKKGVAEDDLAQGWLGFVAETRENDPRIYVKSVEADGPADQAGLRAGQQMMRIDNYLIPDFSRLREMLGVGFLTRTVPVTGQFSAREREITVSYGLPVRTRIQVTVRDPDSGSEKTLNLVVGEREEDF